MLITFYILLLYYLFRSSVINIAALGLNVTYLRENNLIREFMPALILKRRMLRNHCLLSIVYTIMILFGLGFSTRTELGAKSLANLVIIKEVVETAIIWSVLLNLRPRDWPQYFTLDIAYGEIIPQWQLNNVPF